MRDGDTASDADDTVAALIRDEIAAACEADEPEAEPSDKSDAEIDAELSALGMSAPPRRPDPVAECAEQMVLASTDGTLRADARATGTVAVLTVPVGWEEPVARAWVSAVVGNSLDDRPPSFRGRMRRTSNAPYAVWSDIDRHTGKRTRIEIDNEMREALVKGLGLTVVCTDLSEVPAELLAVADITADIRGPSPECLALLAASVGSGVVPKPDASASSGVLPAHLLASMRPDQTASAYLVRVLRSAAATRPAKPPEKTSGQSLDNIHGLDAAVAWGRALITDVEYFRAGRIPAEDLPRGLLLAGPPGTGKTAFLKALGNTANPPIPVIISGYPRWCAQDKDPHLNIVLKRMKEDFDLAKKSAPCLLVLDELDAIPSRETMDDRARDYWAPLVTALLQYLDGCEGRSGVVVVGASNYASRLDPALIRAGRMDSTIIVDMPSEAAIAAIMRDALGDDLPGADVSGIASALAGRSGADAVQAVSVARRAARQARRAVTMADLQNAAVPPDTRTPEQRRRACVHEAGHAVVAAILVPDRLTRVSVVCSAGNGGYTAVEHLVGEGTPREVELAVRVLLAGRAAEADILGAAGWGAGMSGGSDLASATLMLAIDEFSCAGGPDVTYRGDVGKDTLKTMLVAHPSVARRIEERLKAADDAVRGMVARDRAAVSAVAAEIDRRSVLSGGDVRAVMELARRPPRRGASGFGEHARAGAHPLAGGGPS